MVGAPGPQQRSGYVFPLLGHHAQLAVGPADAVQVLDLFEDVPRLAVPFLGLVQVLLLVEQHTQLPALVAFGPAVANKLPLVDRHHVPVLGVADEHLTGLFHQAQVMELHAHLRVIAHAVAHRQRLLVPVLGFVELVLGVAHGAQGVIDQDSIFFVPSLFQDLPGPLVPTCGLVIFELVLGA